MFGEPHRPSSRGHILLVPEPLAMLIGLRSVDEHLGKRPASKRPPYRAYSHDSSEMMASFAWTLTLTMSGADSESGGTGPSSSRKE